MTKKKAINIEIGARVKRAREAAGLTQEAFAELIDLGDKHISAIECGVVGVSLPTLIRICEVLSIPSDVLLFGWSDNTLEDDRASEIQALVTRLSRLPEREFKLTKGIIDKILEMSALNK